MKFFLNFVLGVIFGFGLIISGMFNPKTIDLLLMWSTDWDASLLFAITGIVIASIFSFFIVAKLNINFLDTLIKKSDYKLNLYRILGTSFFGLGWGISGFCVSTATINLAFNEWENLLFFTFMVLGFYGPSFFKKITL